MASVRRRNPGDNRFASCVWRWGGAWSSTYVKVITSVSLVVFWRRESTAYCSARGPQSASETGSHDFIPQDELLQTASSHPDSPDLRTLITPNALFFFLSFFLSICVSSWTLKSEELKNATRRHLLRLFNQVTFTLLYISFFFFISSGLRLNKWSSFSSPLPPLLSLKP